MSAKPSKSKPTPPATAKAAPKSRPVSTTPSKVKPGTAPAGAKAKAPATPAKPVRKQHARTPALEAVGLTKTYGDLVALSPLDLVLDQGEAVVLIGHNGSGKTTFLRMASGLLDSSGGLIEIGGRAAGSLGARSALSYLSDTPIFYDDLSVWEHLEFTSRLHGREDWEQDAANILDHLGIYERADDLPSRFSRGLKQKAAIAIGLIRPFDLLLVDEPFVGLDAAGKSALIELLDDIRAQGAAMIVATHELEFVSKIQRTIALRNGELVHDGPSDGIDLRELVHG
jgi:ABC-2 type transport system ATP-binding protein